MVLIVIVLFIAGFFFPPVWLLLVGYLIYFFASRDSRRDRAVETRVKRMVSQRMEYAEFPDLYYDAAKSYAIAKGHRGSEEGSSSTTMLVNNRSYFVIFIRQNGNGTSISARESRIVQAEIERDMTRHLVPDIPSGPNYRELGKLVAKGDRKAFEIVHKEAQNGDSTAQLIMGSAYTLGSCMPGKDHWIGAQWFEKAAAQGNVHAQGTLGLLHELGQGLEHNPQKAIHWLEMAIEGGNEEAKQHLDSIKKEALASAMNQPYWARMGINKVPGLISHEMAHHYLSELKELLANPEVRLGSPGFAEKARRVEILTWNISSVTTLSIDQVTKCITSDDWEGFESMLNDATKVSSPNFHQAR